MSVKTPGKFKVYFESLSSKFVLSLTPQSTDLNLVVFGIATIYCQTSDWRGTCQRVQMGIRKEKVKQDECEW